MEESNGNRVHSPESRVKIAEHMLAGESCRAKSSRAIPAWGSTGLLA